MMSSGTLRSAIDLIRTVARLSPQPCVPAVFRTKRSACCRIERMRSDPSTLLEIREVFHHGVSVSFARLLPRRSRVQVRSARRRLPSTPAARSQMMKVRMDGYLLIQFVGRPAVERRIDPATPARVPQRLRCRRRVPRVESRPLFRGAASMHFCNPRNVGAPRGGPAGPNGTRRPLAVKKTRGALRRKRWKEAPPRELRLCGD